MAERLRLDKYLVEMGIGSRSQIKEAARKGRIQVNGVVEKKTDRKIDPETEWVVFDGRAISYVKTEYYMLHKPQGVVSATEDNLHRTVLDLIDGRQRNDLFPVGRLDIDTEGLLLITNDGDLAHRLLSPRHHVDKQYFALVEGKLPDDAGEQFSKGITLKDGTPVRPARLQILSTEESMRFLGHRVGSSPAAGRSLPAEENLRFSKEEGKADQADITPVLLTIHEGKFHQVKRMFEALDCQVVYLKRMTMGPLTLDPDLKPGEYRLLTEEEIEQLKEEKD